MTSDNDTTENAVSPEGREPKATKKASAGASRAHGTVRNAKSAKKASATKKAPKAAKKVKGEVRTGRDESKTAKVLDLLKQPGGVTAKELLQATGWQPHSVRGFLSGTIGKKMGLTVISAKGENGERTYSLKS